MIYLIIYIIICGASLVVNSGWFFANVQKKFPYIAVKSRNEDAGMSLLLGGFFGLFGPLGILVVYLMTGFAEHGWINPVSFKRS